MAIRGATKKYVDSQHSDFRVFIDDETGTLMITTQGYNHSKSIAITMDEMPERYHVFFTKYLLCKES